MIRKSLVVSVATLLLLSACQGDNGRPQDEIGSLPEPAAVNPAPPPPSVLLNAAPAAQAAIALNKADREAAARAESRAYTAPIGQQVTWSNAQSGASGTILPTRDFYADNGAYCRDFMQTITLAGRKNQGEGKACQQPDGTWKIVP
jgi:surface antigen